MVFTTGSDCRKGLYLSDIEEYPRTAQARRGSDLMNFRPVEVPISNGKPKEVTSYQIVKKNNHKLFFHHGEKYFWKFRNFRKTNRKNRIFQKPKNIFVEK